LTPFCVREKLAVKQRTAGIAVLDTSPIIDKLYDAVLDFDLWPNAIEDIADALGGGGSALLSNRGTASIWVRFDPGARTLFESRFVNRNPYSEYVARQRRHRRYKPAIWTDHDISTQMDIRATEYFNEYLRPFDFASSLVMDLGARTVTAALNVSRAARKDSFGPKEIAIAKVLQPHLTRAFWLSMKLAEKKRRGDGFMQLLDRCMFAVMLLDGDGRILHANPAGDAMLRERNGLRCEGRQLAALRSDATATLQRLLADAVSPDADVRKGGSCCIPRPLRLPLTATVTPLRSDRSTLFETNPSAIVCVFDPTAPLSFSTKHLQEMFGLSGAEARVGVKLLEGLDQKEIAAALSISFFTVRAHLSQIFQKTNTNRQAEFVSLVMRTVNPVLFGAMQ
jgi:DNA-binding CsgD family transcriptional regulator